MNLPISVEHPSNLPRMFQLTEAERFMMRNGTVWDSGLLNKLAIFRYMREFYPAGLALSHGREIVETVISGALKLQSIVTSQPADSAWVLGANMPIPVNHHSHLFGVKHYGNGKLKMTFKDNETFKILHLDKLQLMAMLFCDMNYSFDAELNITLADLRYSRRSVDIDMPDKKYNSLFIIKCGVIIIDEIKMYITEQRSKNIKEIDHEVVGDLLNNGFPLNLDKTFFRDIINSLLACENDIKLQTRYIELQKLIWEKLAANKNNILEFLAELYFGSYRCGEIDFMILESGEIAILSGESSCARLSGINYLLDFMIALSDETKIIGCQPNYYDVYFSGVLNYTKFSEYPGHRNYDGISQNMPFPFILPKS